MSHRWTEESEFLGGGLCMEAVRSLQGSRVGSAWKQEENCLEAGVNHLHGSREKGDRGPDVHGSSTSSRSESVCFALLGKEFFLDL